NGKRSSERDRGCGERAGRGRRAGVVGAAPSMTGIVYLVGAGPGDPGLLTRRAAEVIARADLVAVDALVSPEIASLITCERIEVGKRSSAHTLPQDRINQLLIDEAHKGKRVVR